MIIEKLIVTNMILALVTFFFNRVYTEKEYPRFHAVMGILFAFLFILFPILVIVRIWS